jgi:UDP-N-acetylmuramoyl-L-alanyl-D-glutamate--2,6-diaminopimelate ligase
MDFFFNFGKKIIPQPIFEFFQPAYHWLIGFLAALFYGFPSKKLMVIGVTGTKGKTTTCDLIAQILNGAGFKTGLATTVNFKIGNREWVNKTKQTMPGRFQLQKLLSQMVKAGCRYAVIETSSEGILQYRHRFIDYKIAVFTNLSPEHIERHGSFENYRAAKLKLFEQAAKNPNAVGIYNLDDPNVGYFLKPKINRQYVYTLKLERPLGGIKNLYQISRIKLSAKGTGFFLNNEQYTMPLIGEFNIYNAAAAICVAVSQGIPRRQIKKALTKAAAPPGRLELINQGQNFTLIVDYAHEPASLETVYKTVSSIKHQASKGKKTKLICLLGATGGGRDRWKRPEMGKIAAKYCDKIILTNEDPYDENPSQILFDIKSGIKNKPSGDSQAKTKFKIKNLFEIIDRHKAIKKALALARKGDVVISTGKGGEVWMCVKNNQRIPWDEKEIVEKELINLRKHGRRYVRKHGRKRRQ